MLKTLKAIIFISLMAGLSWWVVAVVTQQGVLGASNQPSVNQVKQNTQNKVGLSHQAGHGIDNADLALNSTVVLSSCTPSPPGESNNVFDALTICSGQTVSGQVNDNDSDDVYKIWIVANQQLTISMNGTGVGGPGDADLYLYPPGTIDVNIDPSVAWSENIGNSEFIQITVPVGGFWYIDIYDCCDGDGGTDYNLTVTLSASPPSYTTYLPIVLSSLSCTPSPSGESNNVFDALTICSGQTVSGQVNDNDLDDVYKIWTVANQQLTISMNGTGVGGPGDADLYLYPPGTTDVNTDPSVAWSENIGNNEFIQGTVPVGGFWYIDVFDCCDGDGGTNYNLTVTLSGIGVTGTRTFDLTGSGRIRDRSRSKAPD